MRSVQKVSSHEIWKIETFIEEDTSYMKHTYDNEASVPFKVGTWEPHTVLCLFYCSKHSAKFFVRIAISCPVIFYWISSMVWNFFISKVILVLGKAKSCRMPNLGCWGTESPGWFYISQKDSAGDMMHEQVPCDEAANHQLPIALAIFIILLLSTNNNEHWCNTLY